MKKLQVVSTKTEDLKWEPQIVVISPFKSLTDDAWKDCLSLVKEENKSLLDEIESVIETSKDDHVLYIVLAYVEDEIVGFCIFNAWVGQTCSKGILLAVIKDLNDIEKANGFTKLIANLLVEKTLQEAMQYKNHDTMKDLQSIYCIAKDTWAHALVKKFGFTPLPTY